MKGIFVVVLTLVAVFCPVVSLADTVIVDYDGLASPYTRIQDGIDAVSDGGTVMVITSFGGAVTFRGPGNRALDFGGKNITLLTLAGPQQTTIDCEGADRAILLPTGTDSTSHITGFTFLNGYATDGGGAIRCDGGSPRISDCIFRDNSAPDGGAILLTQGPTRITNCEFYGNSASGEGGALHATSSDITLWACTFSDNDADEGGAVALTDSDLDMSLCTLANNGGALGAGVRLQNSTALIEQCVLAFSRHGKSVTGGTPEIFHCCVSGNAGGDDLPGTPHNNLFIDPLICDLYGAGGGNMSLCSNSPCLPSSPDNPWGLQVGSRAQGCADCDSPTEGSSWGSIKALFR